MWRGTLGNDDPIYVDSDSQSLMSVSEPACRHARVHRAWSILHVHRCSSKVSIHTLDSWRYLKVRFILVEKSQAEVICQWKLLNFSPVKRYLYLYPRCLGHHRCDVGTYAENSRQSTAHHAIIHKPRNFSSRAHRHKRILQLYRSGYIV